MDTVKIIVESVTYDAAPRKLAAIWTVESEQKLCEYYGSRHIWKIYRCHRNAERVAGRRRNYWTRQASRYNAMKRA
jgi:hypothetical protein